MAQIAEACLVLEEWERPSALDLLPHLEEAHLDEEQEPHENSGGMLMEGSHHMPPPELENKKIWGREWISHHRCYCIK